MAQTPAEIIEGIGGTAAVARVLEVEPGAVRVWKSRNRIPRAAWPELIKRFPKVTLDKLLSAEKAARTEQADAA